jgi:hypothetical protein
MSTGDEADRSIPPSSVVENGGVIPPLPDTSSISTGQFYYIDEDFYFVVMAMKLN